MGELLAVDSVEELPQDKRVACEKLAKEKGHQIIREMTLAAAHKYDCWAGTPLPIESCPLVIEPRYPIQISGLYLDDGRLKQVDDDLQEDYCTHRNTFWSSRHRAHISVYETHDGKIFHVYKQHNVGLQQLIHTLGASDAWNMEAESKALAKLSKLVSARAFKQYFLTGSFLETSAASGVTYMFRKLRPTVALGNHNNDVKVLCCLCLHPIGYYDNSWAGALVPTDDIIAHLTMMRGDERHYWSKAEQHRACYPESGVSV